jgi:hypothetical protein
MRKNVKLKTVIGHLDGCSNTELYIGEEKVWSGSTLLIAAAADAHGDKAQFLRECEADEEYADIGRTLCAEKFLNYKLDTDVNGEAISAVPRVNEHGVTMITFQICLKK